MPVILIYGYHLLDGYDMNSILDDNFSGDDDYLDLDFDICEYDTIPCRFCGEPSISGICGTCDCGTAFADCDNYNGEYSGEE